MLNVGNCLPATETPKKAMVAVGHSILVMVYHVLRDQEGYKKLGGIGIKLRR